MDLYPGQQVFDVATGTGKTARAAARRGCEVIGLGWATSLLGRGRAAPCRYQALPVLEHWGQRVAGR